MFPQRFLIYFYTKSLIIVIRFSYYNLESFILDARLQTYLYGFVFLVLSG